MQRVTAYLLALLLAFTGSTAHGGGLALLGAGKKPAAVGSGLVQSKSFTVVQTAATETFVMDSAITAGNTVIAAYSWYRPSGTDAKPTSGGWTLGGTAGTLDFEGASNAQHQIGIVRASNVTGGTANVVMTWGNSAGTVPVVTITVWEYNDMPTAGQPDRLSDAPGGAFVTVTATLTAATTQANTRLICINGQTNNSAINMADPATGYTAHGKYVGTTYSTSIAGRKDLSATETSTCAITADSSTQQKAIVVAYKRN